VDNKQPHTVLKFSEIAAEDAAFSIARHRP
jgi:hypothetical protein